MNIPTDKKIINQGAAKNQKINKFLKSAIIKSQQEVDKLEKEIELLEQEA
jgi:hypothetical protein